MEYIFGIVFVGLVALFLLQRKKSEVVAPTVKEVKAVEETVVEEVKVVEAVVADEVVKKVRKPRATPATKPAAKKAVVKKPAVKKAVVKKPTTSKKA